MTARVTAPYRGNLTARIYQVLSAGFSTALARDLEVANDLNAQYMAAFSQGRLADGKLEVVRLHPGNGKQDQMTHRQYSYLRVYKITPTCDMGGVEEFLDFSPETSKRLIEQGFSEARSILSGYCERRIDGPGGAGLTVTFPPPA